VTFPSDSRLLRIEHRLFSNCRSLRSLVIPALVEFIGYESFQQTYSLSSLSFASQSHLRELRDWPPGASQSLGLPDAVEFLSFRQDITHPLRCVLTFDRDSRLRLIAAMPIPGSPGGTVPLRVIVHVTSRSLKVFRLDLEFAVDRPSGWIMSPYGLIFHQ
jgi:hypothetical protein